VNPFHQYHHHHHHSPSRSSPVWLPPPLPGRQGVTATRAKAQPDLTRGTLWTFITNSHHTTVTVTVSAVISSWDPDSCPWNLPFGRQNISLIPREFFLWRREEAPFEGADSMSPRVPCSSHLTRGLPCRSLCVYVPSLFSSDKRPAVSIPMCIRPFALLTRGLPCRSLCVYVPSLFSQEACRAGPGIAR
jgi:hypothetical protein